MLSNCTLKERERVVDYSLAVLLFEFIQNDSVIAPDTGIVSATGIHYCGIVLQNIIHTNLHEQSRA